MGLKSFLNTAVQNFRRKSNADIQLGIQISKTFSLIPIYGAFTSSNLEITKAELVQISGNGVINPETNLFEFPELKRINLPLGVIRLSSDKSQYLIDNEVSLDLIMSECIYYIEFTNGYNIYKTEAFMPKVNTYDLTFDLTVVTWDSTKITFDKTKIKI